MFHGKHFINLVYSRTCEREQKEYTLSLADIPLRNGMTYRSVTNDEYAVPHESLETEAKWVFRCNATRRDGHVRFVGRERYRVAKL